MVKNPIDYTPLLQIEKLVQIKSVSKFSKIACNKKLLWVFLFTMKTSKQEREFLLHILEETVKKATFN